MPINPFVPNAPFLYPLNTLENHKVFRCFQGLEKGCIGNKWVNQNQSSLGGVTLIKRVHLIFLHATLISHYH